MLLTAPGSRYIARATFTIGLLLLVALPLTAAAQAPGKTYRLGYLAPNPRASWDETFFQALRELGYVEGQNLVVEYRHGVYDRLPELASELVRGKMDVLVSVTPQASLAAKAATSTIPIIFFASDPVGVGLVPSLARPGGNVTGLAYEAGLEIYGKQLEMLKQVVPTLARVIVPAPAPLDPARSSLLKNIAVAGQSLGIQVTYLQGRDPAELDKAFDALPRRRGDALLVPPPPFFATHMRWVIDLAARRRLPAVYSGRRFAVEGGLMAYGASIPASFRRLAVYVDKILKGTKPGDLPVEQPDTFVLVVNLKTAQAQGLTIPPSLLARADEVIQ